MRVRRHNWLAAIPLGLGIAACSNEERFVATMNGGNEVPPVTTNATGTATFTLTDAATLTYTVAVSSISNVTASHIHLAPTGTNGGVVVTLFAPSTPTGGVSGTLASGTITAANVSNTTFDSLLVKMRSGGAYVNAHTTNNPGGEIRGQIAKQE
jgi:hypothetical protein